MRMKISTIFTINRRLIAAMNSCDQQEQLVVINDIMKMSEDDIAKIFRKKYFIWNICRSKDFYKVMARYVCDTLQSGDFEHAILALRNSLVTAKNDRIRHAFVKAIMKSVPLVTVETIMYASPERMRAILSGDIVEKVIADSYVQPFIVQLIEQRNDIAMYQAMAEFNDTQLS